jgi:hypothetical protein
LTLVGLSGCAPAPEHQGNPNANEPPLTAQQRQEQADRDKDVHDLADQVVQGEKSFEQAGCEIRGGDWDDDRMLCAREFMIPRSDTTSTQDTVLADRIAALAAQSSDAAACTATATPAAKAFLADHLRDYRGAVARAIVACRKALLLSAMSPEARDHLMVLTDAITIKPQQ